MSTALTGPAADLGMHMRAGVAAAFAEQNSAGGVRGQLLDLIVLDDGYEPSATARNMRQLTEVEQVAAVVGNVGTPTAVVAIPIATDSRTPFVGAFTGAGILRKSPPDRYVINFRASYAEETAAMVEALIRHGVLPSEIAILSQRDSFGDVGSADVAAALERYAPNVSSEIVRGTYERNTLAVEGALADIFIQDPLPKVVIMIGTYAPCAKFIRLAKEVGFQPRFIGVSFVGSNSLARELGPQADGVIITQVVPDPNSTLPLVSQARKALELTGGQLNFGSLEGYAVGRMLCLALKSIEGPISREAIVDALEGLGQFDIGLGEPLELTRREHQASHCVWPTLIRDGNVVTTTWDEALSPRPERP
jgi:ABC-type branched-subunit amino acid transport system substrate-binding protein